ncbi:UvrD-helicase domain-containing protein [Nocardioides caldifontis]|uniref:UvrD-helicase domain-containing protein n=1 Tax=Nocardioides caldifontis TaxID=2588938 RepID=UPI0011DF9E15|nr:ATP-dependent helicase [Nocardioides caldifontis]
MGQLQLDETRRAILDAVGHVLIEGGPGCGKTTIALWKARESLPQLQLDQRVLFLSFSRAAVRQVTDRMVGVLSRGDRERIEVRTFHAFFLDVVRSHARLLTGKPARFITPERESQLRADHVGDWQTETIRLAREESVFVFDTLAPTAASLLEGSDTVRSLYSAMYPLVIVDEFQDTNRDQWRVVQAFASESTVLCLADPDQRIFEHLDGVDEHRLSEAKQFLRPTTFDLSADNHRSPGGGLLDYANAVLRNRPATPPEDVRFRSYRRLPPELMAHWAVAVVAQAASQQLGPTPTIAVLTRANSLAARVSEALEHEQTMPNSSVLPPVEHVLHWDPELAASAGLVVASVLEWPHLSTAEAVIHTLTQIAEYYRVKVGRGTHGARRTIATTDRAIEAVRAGRAPSSKTAKILIERAGDSTEFTGQPVRDWQAARARLAGSTELNEVFKQVRLLRLLHATDALAWALLDAWDGDVGYRDAVGSVRVALAEEAVNAARQDPPAVSVMTMHKSKGKEFDAVVIVEGRYDGPLISGDPRQADADRRLLRVAITRARHWVVFIRPEGATPLTPVEPRS